MSTTPRRYALVTGASGGIGQAVALALIDAGWDLVVHASGHPDRLQPLIGAGANRGRVVQPWVCDLTRPEPDVALRGAIADAAQLTALVHVAGVTGDGLAVRAKSATIERVLRVNLTAAIELVRTVSRGMLAARFGRVVLVGSTAALAGNAGQAVYAAAKAGQIGFVRALARELGDRGITANVVAPGWIETAMTDDILKADPARIAATVPVGRIGRPAEVAAAVRFLLSDDGAYITGQTLQVNGGLWMG